MLILASGLIHIKHMQNQNKAKYPGTCSLALGHVCTRMHTHTPKKHYQRNILIDIIIKSSVSSTLALTQQQNLVLLEKKIIGIAQRDTQSRSNWTKQTLFAKRVCHNPNQVIKLNGVGRSFV